MGGSNAAGGVYSGHADGQIRTWLPRLEGAEDEDAEAGDEREQDADGAKSKKRKALDDAFRSLMGNNITFT
jgi:DNA excision repair protein ERCC-8